VVVAGREGRRKAWTMEEAAAKPMIMLQDRESPRAMLACGKAARPFRSLRDDVVVLVSVPKWWGL
jgi:hypothetical protein